MVTYLYYDDLETRLEGFFYVYHVFDDNSGGTLHEIKDIDAFIFHELPQYLCFEARI